MIMNNKAKGMWKEAVMASFKVLSYHLPGKSEGNHKRLQSEE
jgi:hypothetical protein